MKNKTFLITGGNGFIGTKIIEKLVFQGYTPSLLLRKNSNRKRLSSFARRIKIFEADLRDGKIIASILRRVNPTIIIHLAGYGVYSYGNMSSENIGLMIDSNIKGTINLLYAAHNTNCKLFINTGSCFEYGSSNFPFKENSMLNPNNMYGVTKSTATFFCQAFSKKNKFAILNLRPFTVYGPGEDERRFVSTVIKQCLEGKNPSLAKKKIVRDYIYIDDVADAYLCALDLGEKLSGEIINVSTGKGTVLEDVARMVIRLTGANVIPDIGSFSLRDGEVLALIGDTVKAEKLLGWKAKYSLEEGIKKTIAWIKKL